jgi:hypothetical protein
MRNFEPLEIGKTLIYPECWCSPLELGKIMSGGSNTYLLMLGGRTQGGMERHCGSSGSNSCGSAIRRCLRRVEERKPIVHQRTTWVPCVHSRTRRGVVLVDELALDVVEI